MKKRLDVLLVERGLAESRAQAQAFVLAGLVPGFEKPGQQVEVGGAAPAQRVTELTGGGSHIVVDRLQRS